MKIYVASSWRNTIQPRVVHALRNFGHEVYDFKNPTECLPAKDAVSGPEWKKEILDQGFHWTEILPSEWTPDQFRSALDAPSAKRGFEQDMDALETCGACVLVLPCGKSAHLELGYLVGKGKLTIVYFPEAPAGALADAPMLHDGNLSVSRYQAELMYRMCDYICTTMDEVKAALSHKRPYPKWQRDVEKFDARAKANGMDVKNLPRSETYGTMEDYAAKRLGPCRPYHHRACVACGGCWRHGACTCSTADARIF